MAGAETTSAGGCRDSRSCRDGFVVSEYLVASKEMGNFDFTLGMGWGRLAGKGDINNPLIQLSDRFAERETDVGLGGELSSGAFFSGEKAGFFGGAAYQFDSLPCH